MKLAGIEPPQIAIVTWLDASHYPGWFGGEDDLPAEPLKMQTAGWLIERNKTVIVMAMTASLFKLGDLLVIPAGCVVGIEIMPEREADNVNLTWQ